MRALDAEGDGLAVDAFGGSALAISVLVSHAVSIQGVAEPGADAGGHRRGAAPLGPTFVIERVALGIVRSKRVKCRCVGRLAWGSKP